jgi:fructosamine-3-kinase
MSHLPESVREEVVALLGAPLRSVHALGGGHGINRARATTADGTVLIKWSARWSPLNDWPAPLDAEARGLRLLAEAGAIRVPAVLGHRAARDPHGELLVMEWIAGDARADRDAAGRRLGERLAALHQSTAARYGLDHHNYCGATPQPNTPRDSWLVFWREERLNHQLRLAVSHGVLPRARRERLERLVSRLDQWIDDAYVRPSLLHGDLWGGNWLVDEHGEPVVIDPAAYYGDREAELAMCDLFGGFPASFWRSYDKAWPPAPGRDERRPIYQLYHLLNHLNLFGEAYGAPIDAILRRYVG